MRGCAAPPLAAAKAAQNVCENVFAPDTFLAVAPFRIEILRPGAAATRAEAAETLLEAGARAGVEAMPKSFGLPAGIDFTPVELGAFVLIADDLIRRADLLKAFDRFGVVGVLVGMVLLGKVAVGLFDFGLACLFRNTQDFVWIAHIRSFDAPI